jgi:DNA transformation protein and related proteins
MFSGAGVYREGVFFALATSDGRLYLKSDAEIEPRFRAAGSHPFIYGRDKRKITMSYWSLPSEALDDSDALKEWAELSFQAALRKPEKPKRSKKTKPASASGNGRLPEKRPARSARARKSGRRAASRRAG